MPCPHTPAPALNRFNSILSYAHQNLAQTVRHARLLVQHQPHPRGRALDQVPHVPRHPREGPGGRFSVVCCRHLPAPADDDRPAAARSDGLAPERRDGADPDRRDGAAADVLQLPPPANPIALLDVVDWPCCPVVFGLWLMFAVPFLLRVRMTTR